MLKILSALLLCCFLFSHFVQAQEKQNAVKLHLTGNRTAGVLNEQFFPLKNFGISYERNFGRSFGMGAKYNFWLSADNAEKFSYWGYHSITEVTPDEPTILNRSGYQFFDLYASYKLNLAPKHAISLKAGPSVAHGENVFLTRVYPEGAPRPYDCIFIFEQEHLKETYFGGITEVSYDYFFWQNRLSAGVDFTARFYNKGFPLHYNYGLHMGFNF